MARITIQDCLQKVNNRFKLVLIAAKRARQLSLGSVESTVDWGKDKASVVALREIASGNLPLFDQEAPEVKVAEPFVDNTSLKAERDDDTD